MNATEPTVHIVDDDLSFLAAASRLLRASGFAVRTLASATEFLADEDADGPGCAEDFLEKCAPKAQILDAVTRALARDVREREVRARQRDLHARFDTLTKRELDVLSHVVLGRLNQQIASDLSIHERTVKLHRTAITTKLRVQSVAELTRLTDEAGLFTALAPTFPKGL